MKKIFTILLVVISILMLGNMALGQSLLLEENFDYPAGDSLNILHGWTVQSTASYVNTIKVVSPGLTYTGYGSVLGNAAKIDTTGQDLYKSFTSVTAGSVYSSFMVNISKVTTTGDYFTHFTQATTTNFRGRVYAKSSGGNVSFGLMKGSTGTVAYTTATYALNTTHLVVLKYAFNTSTATDDSVYLFINPPIGITEPTPDLRFGSTDADFSTLNAVALRQGTNTTMPRLSLDGIRVGTAWTDIFPPTASAPTATTGSASAVAATTATLNGTINANWASTTVNFDYGLTNAYGTNVAGTPSPVTGGSNTAVSAAITTLTANQLYYFRVNGTNSVATTNGLEATFTTLPDAPVASAASSVGETGFTANWAAGTGNPPATYDLDVATDLAFTSIISGYPVTGLLSTTYGVTGLTGGNTYYYRVRGVDVGGSSANSSTITTLTLPAAPVAAAATAIGATAFTANWGSVTGATSYELDVATDVGFTTFVSGYNPKSVSGTSEVVSPVSSITQYWYRVRAVNATGVSANSNVETATTISASVPTVGNLSSSGIGEDVADMSAEVLNENNSATTERGFVWALTVDPTTADNKEVEGSTGLGVFTTTVTGLPAGTLIHYRGYAINGIGTGYTSDGTFYTLSTEPATHASAFTATTVSASAIDLSWTAGTGATGYIILQKIGSDPTGIPVEATGYSVGNTLGDGTVAAIVTGTSTTISGLTGGTEYHYSIMPFAWDGANAATYNYKTGAPIPTANATTLSSESDVIATSGFTYTANIPYIGYSGISDITDANSVAAFGMTLRDGGTGIDADAVATELVALTLTGTNVGSISRAALYDGTTELAEVAVTGSPIAFSGFSTSAADGGTKDLVVRVVFNNTVTDKQQFSFAVSSVTADPAGSGFAAADGGGAASSIAGDDNRLNVAASKLMFTTNILNGKPSVAFTAAAKATDANNLTDLDFVGTVVFAKASGPGTLTGTTSVAAVLGVATTTDLVLDAGGSYTLSASSDPLTAATSNTFTMESPSATFRIANVIGDTLMWRDPSIWVVEDGAGDADNIPDNDNVILDNKYKSGNYVVKIGYMTTSDSFYTMQIGYPGNINQIKLLIPYVSLTQASTSFRYGDGLVGNIDLLIDEGGVLQNNTARTSGNNLFVRGYTPANDTTLIRTGGKYLHMTLATTSFVKTLSTRLDGDYGIFEWACPASATAPSITSSMIWYPHLIFSGVNGATRYKLYTSSAPGPMYVKGDITVNAGIADTMNITGSYGVAIFGNIINNGSMAFTSSPLVVRGSSAQTISGNPVYIGNGMVMANAAGLTLGNDFTVTGGTVQTTGTYNFDKGGAIFEALTCAGTITSGANMVYLNPAGALNEGENPILGNITATRTANLGSEELFGNIGVGINGLAAAPGVTTVTRKTGVVSTGNGNQSIERYFDITPTVNTGLNATMTFDYATSELNGLDENTLMLFKSEDGGTTWSGKAGTVNSVLNKITASSVNSFSRWTAGSYNSPLFVSHVITVMKIEDKDGDLNTTADQVAKKWRLNLYSGTTLINSQNLNSGVMVTPNLEAGTYTATEEDSIGWLHLGVRVNGVLTTGSINSAEVTVAGGLPGEIIFYNQKASSLTAKKYRDYDGDAGTTADQVAIEWGLSIYKGTISEGTLVTSTTTGDIAINDIQAGTYFVVEEDKGTAWKRINGNLGLIDTVIVAGGDDAVVTFVNFKPNSLTIRKVKDNDGKLSTNNDRVLAPWHLEVHRGTISGALVASSDNGSLDVANLGDDTYVIVESDSANWINLGYALNGTDHASIENNYTIVLSDGMNATFDFVNAPPIYSNMYRSFDPDSIAQSKDLKLKYKYIARKAVANEFVFDITAPATTDTTGKVTAIFKFSMVSSGVVLNGVDTVGTWTNAKIVTTSAVDTFDVLTVIGWGYKGSLVKTGYEWSTLPKKTKGNVAAYIMNQPRLPMPNRLNAVYDAFALTGFPTGLQVGMDKSVPDSTKLFGWLNAPKPGDIAKTLNDKNVTHTALAHSFDTWTSGKPFLKRQKSASPNKYNNVLLAQMVALKLNITASNMEMIPLGFGELIFDDASLIPPTGAPVLNGMMVREIAPLVDSMMMGWAHVDTIIKLKPQYSRLYHDPAIMAYLNTAVTKINNAFEGQLDTTSFASSLVFTGAKKLIDVPYLKGSSVIPAKIVPDYTKLEQIPEAYKLHQNYPNPFNPTTMIQFELPEEAFVTLKVYNLLGQEVATLFNHEQMSEGTQEVEFSASSFASGVYFYRLSAEGIGEEGTTSNTFHSVHKMILMK
ncbi:MAG: hypothetical protein C0417_04680 [Chlorobiaceae bacterium]|nr:hypothetical protein [Chlorobiaceae bacterium]